MSRIARASRIGEPYKDSDNTSGMVGEEYCGREAREAITRRLAGYTKAQASAILVSDFYGDTLRFQESRVLTSSVYEICFEHDPVGLRYARVGLQLGTDRTAESLSHEMLHLGLSIDGYPHPEKIFVPRRLALCAVHLIGIQSLVNNLIEHELIFSAFLDLGFDERRFVGNLPPVPDYEALASTSLLSSRYGAAVEFPWWCLEYFRHWLSVRHGSEGVASDFADRALYWGSRVYTELIQAARQMRVLVESGDLRDNKLYPGSVNRLLEAMRLPGYTEWVTIQQDDSRRPVASNWTPTT